VVKKSKGRGYKKEGIKKEGKKEEERISEVLPLR
jgi:hypothetical protein